VYACVQSATVQIVKFLTVWSGETELIVIIEMKQFTQHTKHTARRYCDDYSCLAQWGKKQQLADQCFIKRLPHEK